MNINIHEGERLKWFIDRKFKQRDDAIKAGIANSYELMNYYFAKQQIKRSKLEFFCKALGISIDTFYKSVNENLSNNTENEPSVSKHQGNNLKSTLKDKGMSTAAFAKKMHVSRPTVYKYFDEKELDTGTLLEAAATLKIPAAQLKGYGIGQASFEKEIYNELKIINQKLNTLLAFAKQRGQSA